MKHQLILKPGREKAVKNFHPWIFSGAVKSIPTEVINGDFVEVHSSSGEILGIAYINRKTSIFARMVSFEHGEPVEIIKRHIHNAIELRKTFFDEEYTNAYRLVNSEGDFFPGLIVDKYNDVLVIQISTLGIEKIKQGIIDELVTQCNPRSIYEKSDIGSRREEGLSMFCDFVYGEHVDEVNIKERGMKFVVGITDSQKTGFFLDQREMRQEVKKLAQNKKVLNCFSYTGGFSVAAALGNAAQVDSVDISADAVERARENFTLNNLNLDTNSFITADVFEFLRDTSLKDRYDLIVLDPPAFAKKRTDVVRACRGYKDINRLAFSIIKNRGIVVTSSCSHYIDEKLFGQVIFEAAAEAKRKVRVLDKHHQAFDHPVSIFHPEGSYLKSLVLRVE